MTTSTRRPMPSPKPAGEAGWVALTGAQSALKDERPPNTRRAVLQYSLVAVVLVVTVGVIGALVIRHVAEEQSVRDVADVTDVLAHSVVQPALTNDMADDPVAATRGLRRALRPAATNRSLVRVKVWTPHGLIVYSDEPRLIGRTYPLDDEAQEAFEVQHTVADVSNLNQPENRYERGRGSLLEVYRQVRTPDGHQLLLEAYYRYDTVKQRSAGLWRGFGGILLVTIVALLVVLVPLVVLLMRRTRRAHVQRQTMAQRAIEASDEERRRIGASMHDGVVQQLVAASYDLAGKAERARTSGADDAARELRDAADTVRGTIGGLRALLVEIYPPSVDTAGLSAATRDLATTVVDGHAHIDVDIDDETAARLSPGTREEIFRVTQECLRNAVKHARGGRVSVRLEALPEDRARLEIADDGIGFDAQATVASDRRGHLGLRLIAHAARRCNGELAVNSRPGHGTRYRMDVPLS